MKVLIVDDENKSRENLQTLVQNYCTGVTVCGLAAGIDEALELIKEQAPQLVLLDISMPGGTGFDLLKKAMPVNFEVIFVTAYGDYGIQAIKANALDYLLKPVSIEELRDAVQKAKKRIEEKRPTTVENLIKQLDAKIARQNKIAVPANDGLIFILPQDIICLTAEGSYTIMLMKDGKKLLSTRHLKEYEDILAPENFIRVHHSHIINLEHTRFYHRGEGGYVVMTDGTEIMISKRKKKDFLDRFVT